MIVNDQKDDKKDNDDDKKDNNDDKKDNDDENDSGSSPPPVLPLLPAPAEDGYLGDCRWLQLGRC